MRDIEAYPIPATRYALRLLALTFVRPGELRQAEWTEVDIDGTEWRIPAPRMKMRRPHIVPLSRQAIMTLKTVRDLTGDGHYVFPQARDRSKPMCGKCLNYALRRLGYSKDVMVGHGFRAMASTLLNEQGYNRDWIERQLAHGESNKIRAAYNFAEYLPERRRMMQGWADYLDTRHAFAILGR
jgi:integrase